MKKTFAFLILLLFCISCATKRNVVRQFDEVYLDQKRNREVPVSFYVPLDKVQKKRKVVIFSHDYSKNQPGANKEYSYLTNALAKNGYFVVSIQQELPTDDLLPMEGKPQIVRRSNWERGADNIQFVLSQLKDKFSYLDYSKVIISGHSNGGDQSVLFTEKYPEKVWKLITLDQRRYAFPRASQPKIYSLRSSDQPSDEAVLPTAEEQEKLRMTIIKLPNTIHNDMDDDGNDEQKQEIINYFLEFLKEK